MGRLLSSEDPVSLSHGGLVGGKIKLKIAVIEECFLLMWDRSDFISLLLKPETLHHPQYCASASSSAAWKVAAALGCSVKVGGVFKALKVCSPFPERKLQNRRGETHSFTHDGGVLP